MVGLVLAPAAAVGDLLPGWAGEIGDRFARLVPGIVWLRCNRLWFHKVFQEFEARQLHLVCCPA